MAYRKTHTPHYKHPLYITWKGIRQRCNNPNHPKYSRYGGRGIKMCARWNDFTLFWKDMGEKPTYKKMNNSKQPIYTLGRMNNDGDYEPDNCRWEKAKTQARNRKSNVLMILDDKKYYLSDLRKLYGVSSGAYYSRIYSGWSKLEAATTPTRTGNYRKGK